MAKLITSARASLHRCLRPFAPRALAALAMSLLTTAPARAQDLSPIDTFFTTLGTALTGTTGRAIGLVALAAVGIAFLFGRMNLGLAVSICVGLVILFGSATILGGFA
ncbi:TrbC/VirB2 family protein [Amaricoccus solimangrovi]|uniref:TrbC/VirB2 family protein n=1 Tax=Amaricoccus solimangrovi TaxID=2589815 RepID=A0A501WJK7_9RHOB|nr:TrbC/VirB2 family protein [Amaricoccus solimangrovi]TPE47317.1 TrbC/VirB2 family protein [Amaricoccus solimangrovi]